MQTPGQSVFAFDTQSSVMVISIIVPVRNEEAFIRWTLDGLLAQEYPSDAYEVLVVDGESSDRTTEIVESYAAKHPQIRLFTNPRKWADSVF